MSINEWFENATAYFNEEMTTEEARLFETKTAASEELSQLMQLWKNVDAEAVVYEHSKAEAAAFIATHQKLKQELNNEQTGPASRITHTKEKPLVRIKLSPWQWTAVAAIIIMVIVGIELFIAPAEKEAPVAQQNLPQKTLPGADSGSLQDSLQNPNAGQVAEEQAPIHRATLYEQNFEADKIPDDTNGPLEDAFVYYATGEYKKAIAAIDGGGTGEATRGNDAFTPLTGFYASYYKALSLMHTNHTAAAIPLLQKAVQQSPVQMLTAKASWYLSLAYLKEEKITDATETLQTLIKNPEAGNYKDKAQKILAEINKR